MPVPHDGLLQSLLLLKIATAMPGSGKICCLLSDISSFGRLPELVFKQAATLNVPELPDSWVLSTKWMLQIDQVAVVPISCIGFPWLTRY